MEKKDKDHGKPETDPKIVLYLQAMKDNEYRGGFEQ